MLFAGASGRHGTQDQRDRTHTPPHAKMTPMPRVTSPLPAALLLTLALTGCSASVGGSQVSSEELAAQVSTVLAETVGRAPELVECPDPLEAEVGAEVRCTLTDGGETYGISVTATEVAGDQVSIDVQVDEEPLADEDAS